MGGQPSAPSTAWCLTQYQKLLMSAETTLVRRDSPGSRNDLPAPARAGLHPASRVRRQAERPAPLHRHRGQGRRDHRADAGRRPAGRAGPRAGRRRTSSPASPPTSWTGSATSSSATTAPTPRRSATAASPSRCARASTRSSATASRTAAAIEDGDIVNIDITAFLDGVHGDTNATFLAGDVDEESRLLVERTREALDRGIKAVKPGRRINVIGRVIESYAAPLRLRRGPRVHRPRHRHARSTAA